MRIDIDLGTRSANLHIALSVKSIANTLEDRSVTDQEVTTSLAEIRNASSATVELINERFQMFALASSSSHDNAVAEDSDEVEDNWSDSGTLVQDDPEHLNPPLTPQSSQHVGDVQKSKLALASCLSNCNCQCHRRYNIKTPQLASSFLGRLSLSYTGTSADPSQCSSERCRAYKGFTLRASYSAPRWLWLRMVHIMCSSVGDPTFVLSAPRVISQDSAIFEMARLGDVARMQKAFSLNWASPLVITEHGETLIQETIHNGFPQAAQFLIQVGADPSIDNDSGVLPSQEAWDYILRKSFASNILEQYRNIFNLTEDDLDDRGFTIIHKLVLELLPTEDLARDIERHQSIINAVDSTGRTAAHWAILRNENDKLQTLLEYGASPHIKDNTWGNTLLDYSVRCPSADLTRTLIDFGADVNTRTTCKWTPLYGCATYRKSKIPKAHVANAKLLVKAGADIDARDEDGVDSLMKAARQDVPLLAEYLIEEAGISTNNRDHMGLTALAYSIRRQSAETMRVILDKGADYTLADNRENTILHAAALEADMETLDVLTNYDLHHINPDAKNADGMTASDVALKRQDIPEGFMPVFIRMLAGIRATRKNGKSRVAMTHGSVKASYASKKTSKRIEEIEDVEEGEIEEFYDAVESLAMHGVVGAG